MSDHKPPNDRQRQQWERLLSFCAEVEAAGETFAQGIKPEGALKALSPTQFAVGKLLVAVDQMLRDLEAASHVRALSALTPRALHRAAWGIADPLFAPASVAGRKGADVPMTVFRALVLKLADELTTGQCSRRAAAQKVASALRRAKAPKGYIPSFKTIQNSHSEATDPKTPTERHFADAYAQFRARQWPETAGTALDERVRWIVEGYRT
jgi:hypothetical protein